MPTNYPRGARPAPDFELIDQSGETIGLSAHRGRVLLLTFTFAHCSTICPAIVQSVSAALRELPTDTTAALLITLDPWRDTPSSLPSYAARWKLAPNARALSGSPEAVNAVLDAYAVPRSRQEKTGDVLHPALVYVIAPDGVIAYTLNNPSASWLIEAADRARRQRD